MTEKATIQEFYDMQTCSDRRLQKIKNIITKSREFIGKDITKLQLRDITLYLKYINDSDYKPWTKNDYKKIFKIFIKWFYKKEFLEWSDERNFKDGFKTTSKKKAFNKEKINKETLIKPEELEKLLRAAKTLKLKAILTLLYESAFRPCEIRMLKWSDLTFDDSRGLCSVKTTSPKTKDTRAVPVKDCIVHLKRWREEYQYPNRTERDFVFPSQFDRTKPIGDGTITTLICRLSKDANMRHIFPYMFRHSRIYEVQKKLGARIASNFAGHSLETSEIYDHLDSDDVEEAMLDKIYATKEITPQEKDRLKAMEEKLKLMDKRILDQQEFIEELQGDKLRPEEEEEIGTSFIVKNGKSYFLKK